MVVVYLKSKNLKTQIICSSLRTDVYSLKNRLLELLNPEITRSYIYTEMLHQIDKINNI